MPITKDPNHGYGKVVIAGCGDMGLPMALRLHHAGYSLSGFDIRPAEQFGDFARHMLTSLEQLRQAEILISVVRDQQQTLDLCFEQQGVFNRSTYPHVLVISSTLSPRFICQMGKRLPDDVRLIDAPMSGASHGARQGELSFMLGGEVDLVDYLMPIFQVLGKEIFYAGELGSGMTLKVLNNYVTASSVVAVRRVHQMASRLGVDEKLMRQVMASSSGATWFGDHYDLIEWAGQGYNPDNTIGILEKDVLSAIDAMGEYEDFLNSTEDHSLLSALRQLQSV